MKNVAIAGILTAAILLSGCRSAINKVRNGYLEYNRTTTVGQALEHSFSNGKWKSFTTDKGVTLVEFDGSHPFKEARGMWGNPDSAECSNNLICAALAKKLADDCNSNPGVLNYQNTKKSLDLQISGVEQQIDALDKQVSNATVSNFERVRDNIYRKGGEYEELGQKKRQLEGQLGSLTNPESACLDNAYEQHADDPIPVGVQFSINSDGTFQYYANDMSWSTEKLFYNMYK
jgi:hypothetical protein